MRRLVLALVVHPCALAVHGELDARPPERAIPGRTTEAGLARLRRAATEGRVAAMGL